MTNKAKRPWVVLKFGGTSVADAGNWPNICAVLRDRLDRGFRPVMVHSALAGVSDRLETLVDSAVRGEAGGLAEQIVEQHEALVARLGLTPPEGLVAYAEQLRRLTAGMALTGEAGPGLRARLLSLGELMATEIAAACLEAQGIAAQVVDARDVLVSLLRFPSQDPRHFLSAQCAADADRDLQQNWGRVGGIIVTQGFIASDDKGRTVLLGRGGSDTSAACFAARLEARRLEIWTDVPGMFSANPRNLPSARLLRRLSFSEAQEIAATGARVLHPGCLPIARKSGIPVHIHDTGRPELAGTVISDASDDSAPRIKAISARRGLTLISMESIGMWQEAGFLAQAFAVFSDFGLSVDLVSTSESVVTVTLDESGGPTDPEVVEQLTRKLQNLCRVRVEKPCAAVSLVGARMRANLHRLAPALEAFEEHRIFLVSQAASDLNFTVVIEEGQVDRLVRSLHELIIGDSNEDPFLGPSWEQLARPERGTSTTTVPWWERKRDRLLALATENPSAYVYDLDSVTKAAEDLLALENVDRVLYAVKANPHPAILRTLHDAGVAFECVSPGELTAVLELFPGLPRERVLFTPNFAPRSEYEFGLREGVRVTLDNLYPLEAWPEVFAGRSIFVRIDLGEGSGHHAHVHTAGQQSKFGIPHGDLERLVELCAGNRITVTGLHVHGGSGIRDSGHWSRVATALAEISSRFPGVGVLDLGGGLGVPEKEGDTPLDLNGLDQTLAAVRAAYPDLRLWLEPGRYLVSAAGVLLVTVNQLKGKQGTRYLGVSTGMNSLIRPALYGAYHRIVNLSRLDEPATELATVVGPICETGDRLGRDRYLPRTEEGDVLLIANAGAYGRAMSSNYNLRAPATELTL
jgi:diaminopimelate decarboxylase/aspartate kinase